MTYIKLEDVQKILDKYTFHSWIFRDEILSLPSINPEAMIEEMIEEINQWWVSYIEQPITILKEAKSRIQKQS